MNLGTYPLLVLPQDCEKTAGVIVERLQSLGFHVIRSFNLKDGKKELSSCRCPRLGTEQCNCEMMVLQVYSTQGSPATLVLLGYDEKVSISLVDTPEQRMDQHMRNVFIRHLNATNLAADPPAV